MADVDYLADLIKKAKEAKKAESAAASEEEGLGSELEKSLREITSQSAKKDTKAQPQPAGRSAGTAQGQPAIASQGAAAQPTVTRGAVTQPAAAAKPAAAQPTAAAKPVAIQPAAAVAEEKGAPEEIIPEKSAVEQELERAAGKKLIDSYGEVKIYQLPDKPLLYYYVPVVRPTKQEKTIISTIKEAATRLITISPYRIRDPEQRAAVYKQRILEILRNSPELHIPERLFESYAENVVREMVGYGIIDPLVRDDKLEEIMIIGSGKPVYLFHREYEMMTSNIEFYSDKEIIDLINRIARQVGRRVDISMPLLDARLPDGSRVNATIPPASVDGSTLTIRKFRKDPYSIIDMITMNTLSVDVAAFLWLCVDGLGAKPANILIAGGTSSGKTTLLNCLASFVPDTERIITIEDTAELNLPLKHWIRLEARPPGLEGKGELTLDILTKNSLRMRPDRIIVGEVRHDEAFTLFTAMNTGHEGCMGTIHANSPQETIVRVTNPPMNVPEVMLSGLDFILI
ncbi:MAG: CpaF family protein, partial [Candidatus Diapherotrites archaeon]|nr:CpaF family protein [Candidatus Diapherotrites archaeon]